MTSGFIGFDPISGSGNYLFSVAKSYGTVEINEKMTTLTVLSDALKLRAFGTRTAPRSVKIDGEEIGFAFDGERVTFDEREISGSLEIYYKN